MIDLVTRGIKAPKNQFFVRL